MQQFGEGASMAQTKPAGSATKTGGYQDMRSYMAALEERGLLKHVVAPVDLKHEIGAIAARSLEQSGPALVFENIKGYEGMPLVVNLVANNKQLGVAFGPDADEAQ